jgi:hypothetical protein
VTFYDEDKILEISLVPGATPLFLAKKTMSDWGVIQDFRHAEVLHVDRKDKQWKPVEIGTKRHFLFDLLSGFPNLGEKESMYIEDEKETWCCETLRGCEVFKEDSRYRRLRLHLPVPKYLEIFVDTGALTSEIL